jgi:hypothetical protein
VLYGSRLLDTSGVEAWHILLRRFDRPRSSARVPPSARTRRHVVRSAGGGRLSASWMPLMVVPTARRRKWRLNPSSHLCVPWNPHLPRVGGHERQRGASTCTLSNRTLTLTDKSEEGAAENSEPRAVRCGARRESHYRRPGFIAPPAARVATMAPPERDPQSPRCRPRFRPGSTSQGPVARRKRKIKTEGRRSKRSRRG